MTEKQIVWYILPTEIRIDSGNTRICPHLLGVFPLKMPAGIPFQKSEGDVDSMRPSRQHTFWVTTLLCGA